MVENADLAGLEKLRADTTTQPTVLMLVASKLTGDAQTIAGRLRELKENDARRNYLVDMIVGCVQSAAEADSISAAKAAEAASAAPAQEEAPAPRKRRSRKKAEAEAEAEAAFVASAIEIAKAKEAEKATTQEPAPAKATPSVATGGDMTPVLDAIAKQHADLMNALTAINSLASALTEVRKEVSALNARVNSIQEQALSASTASAKGLEAIRADAARINSNLGRVKAAFEGFEIELIGSGTIAATPFAENCSDWE